MVNEWSEFLEYTGTVTYAAKSKRDTRYLGRFTWDTLVDFEGLVRVLTVLARGFLFHEPDGSSRAEYAVWHEPQLSTYVCGGMRRRFGECFLYPSCASASPTIPQSKRPVNLQRYLFFMRSLLAAFAVGWTATYPERREEYVNAAFSRHLRERGGRDAAPFSWRCIPMYGGAHPT